jgi:phospholipid/cholesterol/gamma-HCH transport system substrate-binding protein
MEKAENRRAITVGIFLALGLIIFIVGVFTLGGQSKSFSKSIHISAVFDDVAGLKAGNSVWFSGVKVGSISKISFIGPAQVDVIMRIDESSQQYIHRNAEAHIGSDGLIGNKIIVIDGGSPQAPEISDGNVLQAEKLLSTDDLMKTLQQNNENLLAITTNFKLLSRKILQGQGAVGTLMTDSTAGLQLRASIANLQAATASAAQMAVSLNKFSAKLNTKGGFADKVFTDTSTFPKIQAAVAQLKATADNASTITGNLTKASNKLNSSDNAIGVLLNDPASAAKLKSTIDNLQQSSVNLNLDLQAAQHNFLLKGFFKDRAKAKADSIKKANEK